jgi:hypothetical protein
VVAFLVMDIQQSPQWAEELLEKIEAVASGRLPQWERIGNAYRVEITVGGVLIEDAVDEKSPAYRVSLAEFRAAVATWRGRL